MARFLTHSMHGLAKQLIGISQSLLQESLPPAVAAANALTFPLQQCWMHSPACSRVASSAHSYHGSRDDDEDDKQNRTFSNAGQAQATDTDSTVTRQMEAIQEAIEHVVEERRTAREAGQLPEHVARHFMRDPLGMILSSQGVPMGISLKVEPKKLLKRRQEQLQRGNATDQQDWRELLSQMGSSSSRPGSHNSTAEEQGTAVPRTDAQLLKHKFSEAAKKLIREAHRVEHTQEQEQQQQHNNSSPGDSSSADSSQEQHAATPVGQQVREQLAALMAAVDHDSWGTTQQSPAEIAQHIADSNRRAGTGGGGGGGAGDGGADSDDEPLELTAAEERYSDQAAVTAELKEMDEIFEVLAKVPWLDDGDVDERELRGVVAVGLLGTLEEVGWQLREPLAALWAGERDLDKLTADAGPREAAALTAILYHTQQLEQQYDKPPAHGIAAALAAAGVPVAGSSTTVLDGDEAHREEGGK